MTASRIRAVVAPVLAPEESVPEGWVEKIATYLDFLAERNRSQNLVSRGSVDRLVEGQLLPSLAALRVMPAGEPLRVVDVGSGGGFPGVPLAILRPAARVDLVDATGKKCAFLREAIRELRLPNAEVHWCRMEDPTPELLARAPFDLLLARAVGSPDLVRSAASLLLAPGGTAWKFVAPDERAEDLRWPTTEGSMAVTALRRLA